MSAQSWTAPTIQGEDPVSGETYKLYNVEAGKFLAEGKAWFGWSTTAILASSGSDFTYTGNASSFTLKTHRSGNAMVFTSGNNIEGDAMHVDGANATNYGHTKLASGYYHIHDAGGDASSKCWGYNSTFHATGVVAHADATVQGWNCDWIFVTSDAMKLYSARLDLYNLLLKADKEGADTDAASTVYNNASATVDDVNAACVALNLARLDKFLEGKTASKENPIEITGYVLINPDFEDPTANGQMPKGWTITISGQNCGQMNRTDKNPDTNLTITNFIEAWHPSSLKPGVIAQTVSSLPEGTYVLECDASVCHDPLSGDGTDIKGANLFIKSSLKTEREPVGNIRLGIKHYSVSFVHGGTGEVQFGLEATNEINANWLSADNFKIFYAGGVDLSVYEGAYNDAIKDVTDLEGLVPASAYATAYAVVTANTGANKPTTSAGFQKAISDIEDAAEAASAYVEPYAEWKATKEAAAKIAGDNATLNAQLAGFDAKVEAATTVGDVTTRTNIVNSLLVFYDFVSEAKELAEVPNTNSTANEAFQAAITTQAKAALTAAMADTEEAALAGIDEAKAAVKEAMKTYVFTADPQEGSQFDLTFLITTPDMTPLWTGQWWVTPDGWDRDQEGGNFQVMQNGSVDAEDGVHKVFTEYYYLSDGKTWGNGKFNLYTEVTLPKGTYEMSCYAFAKEENYSSGDPKPRVFFYANDTQGSNVNSSRLTKQSISFVTDEEQDVKIGLKPLEGNTYNWMGIGYVELYKQFTDYTEYGITLVSDEFDATLTTTGSKNKSMALKTVTVNVEIPEGMNVEVTAEELDENGDPAGFIDVANPEAGVYTYQQPRANVKVTVQREKKEIVVKLYKPTEGSSETHGLATFIAPYEVNISDKKYNKDIQAAYTVDGVENGELVLTEVEEGLIPAYTPVILECKKTKSVIEVTFNDNVEKPTKTAPYTEGLLTGVLTETYAPAGKYVLQNQDDGLAFYRVDKEKTIKVPAYKAYLTMEGSAAKAIFFPGEDEEANAIAALDVLTSGYDGIYTANGVQVNALQKGLNIVKKGGKSYKIFVK